jgi:hypothetical protein
VKQINKTFALFFGALFVFIAFCFVIQNNSYQQTGQAIGSISEDSNIREVNIGYSNIEKELSRSGLVQNLPKYSIILLRFYHFENGERIWEKHYIIKKDEVQETDNFNKYADITLSIDSKYLKELTNENFCETIKRANENGNIEVETGLSNAVLIWRFKSMYEYRDCLGF